MHIAINLQVIKDTISDGYKIQMFINDALNTTDALFVINVLSGEFDRVSSRYDLSNIPEDPQNGIPVHRVNQFTRKFGFDARDLADKFEVDIIAMVGRLIDSLNTENEFIGDATYPLP